MRKMLTIIAAASLVGGCKIQTSGLLDSNKKAENSNEPSGEETASGGNSDASKPSGNGGSWKTTSRGKHALKSRPKGHPEGEPWVELWVDQYPENEAKPLKTKLKAKNENKICNGLDDDGDGEIDEECGSTTSKGFQAAIAWETASNVDLEIFYKSWDGDDSAHVTATYGSESRAESFIGGGRDAKALRLQADKTGSCSCNARYINGKLVKKRDGCEVKAGKLWAEESEYHENIAWDGDEAPPGIYEIKFYHRSGCGSRRDVRVNLGVSVNGKTVGHYRSGDLGVQGFSFPILKLFVPPKN